MNILLTGSKGFIGSSLARRLYKIKNITLFTDENAGDLSDLKNWENFKRVDLVIHLASKTNSLESNNKIKYYLENNLLSAINGLEYCKKNNSKFIFISSYIYSKTAKLPVDENSKIEPSNPYSLSKKLIEDVCLFYKKNHKIKIIILRPSNVYGPDFNSKSFIMLLTKNMINQKDIEIRNLNIKRDYIYIDDLNEAIYKSINYEGRNVIFNVGSGKSTSHSKLINILKKYKKYNLKIISPDEYINNNLSDSTLMDISLIKKEIKWKPRVDINEGIESLIKYQENYYSN